MSECCPKCEQKALEIDDRTCCVACSNCGFVVSEAQLVSSSGFFEGLPQGQLVNLTPGCEGSVHETTRVNALAQRHTQSHKAALSEHCQPLSCGSLAAKAEAELRRVADSLDVIHVVIEEAVHLLTKDALGPCTVQHHIPAYLVAGACLCASARRHNYPVHATDVAAELQVAPRKFVAVISNVLALLGLTSLRRGPEGPTGMDALSRAFVMKGIEELTLDKQVQAGGQWKHLSLALWPQPPCLCICVISSGDLQPATAPCLPALAPFARQELILDDTAWILTWAKSDGIASAIELRNLGAAAHLAMHGRQIRQSYAAVAAAFRQSERSIYLMSIRWRQSLLLVAKQLPWMTEKLNVRNVSYLARSLAISGALLKHVQQPPLQPAAGL